MSRRGLSLIKWSLPILMLGIIRLGIRNNITVDLDTFNYKDPVAMTEAPEVPNPAYKGVDLHAHNYEDPVTTTQTYPRLPEKEVLSTFVWHKPPKYQIPKGYSNNPVDLEEIIDLDIAKHCGPAFEASTPVLVKIEDGVKIKDGGVQWHVIEVQRRRGNMQMVNLLLEHRADLDVRDNNSMTAAEMVWGMRLAYSESGQESKAARIEAIYTQLHGREHRRFRHVSMSILPDPPKFLI